MHRDIDAVAWHECATGGGTSCATFIDAESGSSAVPAADDTLRAESEQAESSAGIAATAAEPAACSTSGTESEQAESSADFTAAAAEPSTRGQAGSAYTESSACYAASSAYAEPTACSTSGTQDTDAVQPALDEFEGTSDHE